MNEVRRVEQKIKAKDKTKDQTKVGEFPDGEILVIDTQAACFKVIYEASAIMKTLFSTGKIEKSVYLESTKGKVTIHGPPLLTGVIEGVSKEVTDLTSTGKMVYDLVVDEEVYEQTLEGMSSLKDEIGNNPSLGMKILAEGLLEETIGVGSEELNKLFTQGIDKGQKGHTISRATTGVVMTAIAISEMAKMLPSIAKKMGKRVKFTKSFSRFKDVGKKIGNGTDELFKRVDELGDQGRKFLEDFADAPNETIKALLGNPKLVNAWKVLEDAGIGTKSIDDVKFADDYLKKNPKAKVADEIADAGGFGKWKSAAKSSTQAFKSFTKSNYRHNLQVLTGKSGAGMDAHHIFPQAKKFQSYFQKAGINIHDPKNMSWWSSGAHRSAAHGYNNAWSEFFRATPNATRQQIESFGSSLMKSYGF